MGAYILERKHFDSLLELLKEKNYTIIGPTVKENAIVLDEVTSVTQLPIGWTDEQANGKYRLHKSEEPTVFNYTVGAQSVKKYLFPPVQKLFMTAKYSKGGTTENIEQSEKKKKIAFFGIRPCELAALKIQDKIFLEGEYVDPFYQLRRKDALLIVVNCTRGGGTCFCSSMGVGPRAEGGFDLALTEMYEQNQHFFVLEAGSEKGSALVRELKQLKEGDGRAQRAIEKCQHAAAKMGKSVDTTNLKELLAQQIEHPEWEKVAERCLSCANCTLVCPTCFCSTVDDVTELSGASADRIRRWDSCFTLEFSYIHGGSIRTSVKSRYRQWLTHKFSRWIDQFGTYGCVGCGRCITWCPVGIDVTEEIRTIRETSIGQ